MAPSPLVTRHDPTEGTGEPLVGLVISVVLSMLSISTLSAFMSKTAVAFSVWDPSLLTRCGAGVAL